MDRRRPDIERWLINEQEGEEDAADAAFAQLLTALPRVEPSAGFVDRTVHAAMRVQARRRAIPVRARAAAGIVVFGGGVALAYAALVYAGGSIVGAAVAIASRAVVAPVVFVASRVEWWSLLARAAATVAEAIATPRSQAALVASEVVCVLAVYALQRLLRTAPGASDSWEVRI